MRSETLMVRSAATPRVSNHEATGYGQADCFARRAMKDFANAAFSPETVEAMTAALEASVATLPEPVSSHLIHRLAESILRAAQAGEQDPSVLQRMALMELQIGPDG